MIWVTVLPAASTLAKLAMTTCAQAGEGISLTVISVTTPSMPSGADEHRQQVQAGRIGRFRAELDDLPVDGHHTHAQHVVNRQPVLEGNVRRRVLATLPPIEQAIWLDGSGAQ